MAEIIQHETLAAGQSSATSSVHAVWQQSHAEHRRALFMLGEAAAHRISPAIIILSSVLKRHRPEEVAHQTKSVRINNFMKRIIFHQHRGIDTGARYHLPFKSSNHQNV